MFRNYFTLFHAARELHKTLAEGTFAGAHSQEKNQLVLSFLSATEEQLQLTLFTRSPKTALFTRNGHNRKKKETASLWSKIENERITSVAISPVDREITIILQSGRSIMLQLFASNSNAFLLEGRTVIDAFKRGALLKGSQLSEEERSPSIIEQLETLASSPLSIADLLGQHSGNIEKAIAVLPGFDKKLQRELLGRIEGNHSAPSLHSHIRQLLNELLNPLVQTGRSSKGAPEFSILRTPLNEAQEFGTVLEGLAAYTLNTLRHTSAETRERPLRSALTERLKKIRKELQTINPDAVRAEAQKNENFGHLLIASLYLKRTQPGSICVPDIFTPDSPPCTIQLQSELNLQQNAEQYFRKATKGRGKIQGLLLRKEELLKQAAELEAELAEMTEETASDTRQRPKSSLSPAQKKPVQRLPFRSVSLGGAMTLLIGKNAADNNLLTFKHARSNDIWLHARGASGSHCILKGAGPDHIDAIIKAASIAAWHSKAKHSGLVPVIYTLKKYVRQGRNLPPGQVVVEREKVLLVKPEKELS
ncbi:MAG: NFACT RNA binding domain-containing protein [Candidatus Chlorobium antarcticum]|jgi:predicted ribosome quality control (RQC) complex YloA/Tae2 family protein|nr:NFACT RNA binding domain-containing protein [Candidatus Chlorobium antarcticum]